MAYIPDIAIEKMSEVSDSAFKMFVYFCKRRNNQTGVCFPSLKTTAKDCGINYCYASVIRKELVKKGWIQLIEDRVILCVLGFGNSKDSLDIPNSSLDIPKGSLEIPNPSLDIPNSIYKEVLNQDTQPTQLTNTQTEKPSDVRKTDSVISGDTDEPKPNGKRARKQAEPINKLPEDFSITDEMRSWANEKVPNVSIDEETEEFVNFWCHIAVRNNQRTLKGWIATWQGRMREIEKRIPQSTGVKTNGNGNTTSYRKSSDTGASERKERVNTIVADSGRFKSPELD
jgi:hypothetical protein